MTGSINENSSAMPRFMNREQLALWLNVSVRHTYSLEHDGCPRTVLGSAVRFDRVAVERYLAERTIYAGAINRSRRNRRIGLDAAAHVDLKKFDGRHARVALGRTLASAAETLAPSLAAQARAAARRPRTKS